MTVKHSIDAAELLTRYTSLVKETVREFLQESGAKLIGGYVDRANWIREFQYISVR